MRKILLLGMLFIAGLNLHAQNQKPKLVVGVVVDQMRFDYLNKFENHYSDDGFKRLKSGGFEMKNLHFDYVPTYTAPGHTSVFTGTSPMMHGIISNSWFNKTNGEYVYCASDDSVNPLGTKDKAGKMSPHRLLTTTFADQNRLHTQFRGKTIGVSIKDRGAILPAGHTANAAYWFHGKDEGHFISSDFYFDELPEWVQEFNKSKIAKSYLKEWKTLKPIESYTESGSDENNYENGFKGKKKATFPYDLKKLSKKNGGYDILKATAYGNSLLLDFAKAAINHEKLGQGEFTDVLTLSFSSTDYVGHNFGVNSKEIQDTYVRLDLEIADLLNYLDKKVGEGNYTLFLTADHGAVHVPQFLKDEKIPAGYFDTKQFRKDVKSFVEENLDLDASVIRNISNNQIFLDYDQFKTYTDFVEVQNELKHFLIQYDQIDKVFTRENIENNDMSYSAAELIKRGFNQKRSGDVIYALNPSVISYSRKGSTHGSSLNYDTQAPFLIYGAGIKQGQSFRKAYITDIAPTISALLGTAMPNGATGHVIIEALK
ncbi:alkaline phosphatase PafA [Psychroflexus halocasei]|uniref:Predicted pyrophosphatase or phosphodiesterase, AlkP superfamily n=1 Tax=Psychroflexus halocasei TaxID=908615 RepID=A0A1H3VER6_9FLAO|nr:alkaline phosphatase PafA [Psychroflexus halocasei]SDZ72688.1 Predicted pyrophosphatase or phosphodiesterase, AlkP superfamily [Psychroflexus halocasei]